MSSRTEKVWKKWGKIQREHNLISQPPNLDLSANAWGPHLKTCLQTISLTRYLDRRMDTRNTVTTITTVLKMFVSWVAAHWAVAISPITLMVAIQLGREGV